MVSEYSVWNGQRSDVRRAVMNSLIIDDKRYYDDVSCIIIHHTLTTRQTQAIQGISGVGKRGEYFYLNTRGGCHSIMCEVSSLWSMVVGRYNMVILLFL